MLLIWGGADCLSAPLAQIRGVWVLLLIWGFALLPSLRVGAESVWWFTRLFGSRSLIISYFLLARRKIDVFVVFSPRKQKGAFGAFLGNRRDFSV